MNTQARKKQKTPRRLQVELTAPKRFPFAAAIKKTIQSGWSALPRSLQKPLENRYQSISVSVSIIGKAKMHQLNLKTRGKNRPTDVLAFSQLEGALPDRGMLYLGDIVICESVARIQAKEYGATLKEELQRLTAHGFLHLMGYDHEKNATEAKRMFRLQDKIIRKL